MVKLACESMGYDESECCKCPDPCPDERARRERVKNNLKEYTVALYTWLPNGEEEFLDETSVDAHDEKEALETALSLFLEFHPHLDADFVKEMMRIEATEEISEEERREIEGQQA